MEILNNYNIRDILIRRVNKLQNELKELIK